MILTQKIHTPFVTIPPLCLFEGKEACFLLNGKTGTAMLIDPLFSNQIKEGTPCPELIAKMISRGMVAEIIQEEPKAHPTFFLIDMTQSCNFACTYCLRNPEAEGLRISNEMLDQILDKIIEYCRNVSGKLFSTDSGI